MLVLLLYVDDMLVTGSCIQMVTSFISTLKSEFTMTDLGSVHYFLGIQIQETSSGLFLSQTRYIQHLLEKAKMADCKPRPTPIIVQNNSSETAPEYEN